MALPYLGAHVEEVSTGKSVVLAAFPTRSALRFSPDGKTLLIEESGVGLWNLHTGGRLATTPLEDRLAGARIAAMNGPRWFASDLARAGIDDGKTRVMVDARARAWRQHLVSAADRALVLADERIVEVHDLAAMVKAAAGGARPAPEVEAELGFSLSPYYASCSARAACTATAATAPRPAAS